MGAFGFECGTNRQSRQIGNQEQTALRAGTGPREFAKLAHLSIQRHLDLTSPSRFHVNGLPSLLDMMTANLRPVLKSFAVQKISVSDTAKHSMFPTGPLNLVSCIVYSSKHYSTSTKQVVTLAEDPSTRWSLLTWLPFCFTLSLEEELSPGRTWVGPTCQDAEVYLDGATGDVVLDQGAVSEACCIHDLTAFPHGRNQSSDVEVGSSMGASRASVSQTFAGTARIHHMALETFVPTGACQLDLVEEQRVREYKILPGKDKFSKGSWLLLPSILSDAETSLQINQIETLCFDPDPRPG